MDRGLLTSCILLGTLAALLLYYLIKARLPAMITLYSDLPEEEKQRVTKQKLVFRSASLIFFLLAAVLLLTPLPRGAVLLAVLPGFLCQYQVACLRRKYPIRARLLIDAEPAASTAVPAPKK